MTVEIPVRKPRPAVKPQPVLNQGEPSSSSDSSDDENDHNGQSGNGSPKDQTIPESDEDQQIFEGGLSPPRSPIQSPQQSNEATIMTDQEVLPPSK